MASSTTSGQSPARAITDANRCTSLTIRTASSTSPASVVRTITVRRRCRSIPTNCFPAYASIRGLLALSRGTWILPSIPAGRRRWEREEAPLLHRINEGYVLEHRVRSDPGSDPVDIQMDFPEAIAVMPVRFGPMLTLRTNMLIALRVHQAG